MRNETQRPNSIMEEILEAQKMYPAVEVVTSTPHFLIGVYGRTPYTRIKMTLTFPEGYPSHPLIANIDQDAVVPPGLKKKLEQELSSAAAACSGRHEQVRAVWERLVAFVDKNLFVPCWRDLKKCVDLIQNLNSSSSTSSPPKASSISFMESKGKIKLSLHNEAYYYNCSIIIDPAYPDYSNGGKSCLIQLQSTNFPDSIENMLTSQAQEIVRRMQDGLPAERALVMSNPIRLPKNFQLNSEDSTCDGNSRVFSQETIQGLKHDTETLKKVNELRKNEAAASPVPGVGSGGQSACHNNKAMAKERKDARRTIQKITDAERASDKKVEDKERQWKLEEKKRLTGYYELYNVREGGTIDPQPSLFVLVTFLVEKITGLVLACCPCCKKRVLPVDPLELSAMYGKSPFTSTKTQHNSKSAKKMKPMRTYCGCWYHKSCLDKFLTEPPFGLACPTENCGRRVFHPEWPGDIKQLERDWAARQARQREIEDAMLFL